MVFQNILVPGAGVNMRVYFRGEDGFVAQHLLDYPEVGPVLYQVRGEGMAESMRGNLLMDAGQHGLLLHQLEQGYTAEGFAETVQEERVFIGTGRGLRPFCQISLMFPSA